MGHSALHHHHRLFCCRAFVCARLRAPEVNAMSLLTLIVLVITVLAMAYLVATLLYPEKF